MRSGVSEVVRAVPPGAVAPQLAAVTMAVMHQRHPSVRSVGVAVGLRGGQTMLKWLRRARELGLVTWVDGKDGTLRPAVEVVAARPWRSA